MDVLYSWGGILKTELTRLSPREMRRQRERWKDRNGELCLVLFSSEKWIRASPIHSLWRGRYPPQPANSLEGETQRIARKDRREMCQIMKNSVAPGNHESPHLPKGKTYDSHSHISGEKLHTLSAENCGSRFRKAIDGGHLRAGSFQSSSIHSLVVKTIQFWQQLCIRRFPMQFSEKWFLALGRQERKLHPVRAILRQSLCPVTPRLLGKLMRYTLRCLMIFLSPGCSAHL